MNSANRRSEFKKGLDRTQCLRRRNETIIRLRKDKKEESLKKRRNATILTTTTTTNPTTDSSHQKSNSHISTLMGNLTNPGSTPQMILNSVRGLRKLLSVEGNPPIEEIINVGAIPRLVQLLRPVSNGMIDTKTGEMIQFEAAWALTNVASTDQTRVVVDHGAIPLLVQLVNSTNADLREQSIWCLGNIAGDCTALRDVVLECGTLDGLIQNICKPATPSLLGNSVWSLSNCCRGKPQTPLATIAPAIPTLAGLLLQGDSIQTDVIVDVCWALSYLSDGDDQRIQAVMDTGATPSLINLLKSDNPRLITPCLRALGNFVSGNDQQTQDVLDWGILQYMTKLLNHTKKSVRKEAHWLISNIAAGTKTQIQTLIKHPKALETIVHSALHDEWDVRKEAIWIISNICTGGEDNHLQNIVQLDGIEALCSVLTLSDTKITLVAMETIENILKTAQQIGALGNSYLRFLDEAGGIEKLEDLQEHESDEVYQKALYIIDKYLGGDDEELENLVPKTAGNQFVFGAAETVKSIEDNDTQMNDIPLSQPFHFQAAPLQSNNFHIG